MQVPWTQVQSPCSSKRFRESAIDGDMELENLLQIPNVAACAGTLHIREESLVKGSARNLKHGMTLPSKLKTESSPNRWFSC